MEAGAAGTDLVAGDSAERAIIDRLCRLYGLADADEPLGLAGKPFKRIKKADRGSAGASAVHTEKHGATVVERIFDANTLARQAETTSATQS
jgi:hypothetical protein